MENRKLRVLIATIDAHGHTNGPLAIGQALAARGHEVFMETERSWKGRFEKFGIREVYYGPEDGNKKEAMLDVILNSCKIFKLNWEEKMQTMGVMMEPIIQMAMNREPEFKQIVEDVQPDIIIVDSFTCSPTHVYSGIPWINIALSNPLFAIDDDRTPPAMLGLSAYKDQHLWPEKRQMLLNFVVPALDKINAWLATFGLPPTNKPQPNSPYGNIYMYPEELDYTDLRPIPPNFYRLDCLVRKDPSEFIIPNKLNNKNGKLVLVSMGSHASADIDLLKRLVNELKKIHHRFILTTGPFGDDLDLPDNVWGDKFLPQTKILPMVDVFITHGGNNSLTESLYFGKPVIVLPIFGDQPDNAQRVQEKGYGIRLDAYKCTAEELNNAIDQLSNDSEINLKYQRASQRLQSADCVMRAADIVEEIAAANPRT